MKASTFVIATAAALLLAGSSLAQEFALGFQGCPTQDQKGTPGSVKTFEIIGTLTTSNNPGADGAQGWSISVAVSGATIRPDDILTEEVDETGVSVGDVHVSTIFDHDGKASTPPKDPFDLDLANAGFVVAEATSVGSPAAGGVSAIVLNQQKKQVLQPNGTQTIVRLTILATVPAEGCTPVTVSFTDGLVGSGQPVKNVITFGGQSVSPTLGSCTFNVCAIGPEFILGLVPAGSTATPSADSVLDLGDQFPGTLNVPVEVLLTTQNLAVADGPQGWSLSVSNESCMTVPQDDPTTEDVDETQVTVSGVHVSTIFDHDGKASTPPKDPFDLDLANAGFVVAEVTSAASPKPGVVSAIVLNQQKKQVLHPNATDPLLRITYRIELTEAQLGSTVSCCAAIEDGLVGSGQPVKNVLTVGGQSQPPTQRYGICIRARVVPRPQKDNFVRGDSNNDGKVDIADAVTVVSSVVPGLAGPAITCKDAGDANDDENLNLADATYIIGWQFLGTGRPPVSPFPACGTDDDSSETTCPPNSTDCP